MALLIYASVYINNFLKAFVPSKVWFYLEWSLVILRVIARQSNILIANLIELNLLNKHEFKV